MSDEIRPAMTAEEWASVQPLDMAEMGWYEVTHLWGEFRPHGVAALNLHEQPFGFTWDDVDTLRGAAANCDLSARDAIEKMQSRRANEAGAMRNFYTDLANRIAALLPPREEKP